MILTKASILFWKNGYSDTSMKNIAEVCGFQPANIYNFFSGKEDILFQILYEEMDQILTSVKNIEADQTLSPVQKLRKIIDSHVKLTLGKRRSSMLLFDVGLVNLSAKNRQAVIVLRDEYDKILRSVISRGTEEGAFAKVDAKLAAFSIASMIARSRIWFSSKGKYSVKDVGEFIYQFVLNGISCE